MSIRCHRRGLAAVVFCLFAPGATGSQGPPPGESLQTIVESFAQKEEEYAQAHGTYRYRLHVKVQELTAEGAVIGEFEQEMEVGFDPAGRRTARLVQNPRVDLTRMGISRVRLDDLRFIPLFILSVEDIPKYEITYLTREKIDEVETFLFRIEPNRPARPDERLYEGLIWVDAEKLDIVRAHGRALPVREGGPFGEYFRRVEVFREPVDDFLFPTYVRSHDVVTARGERLDVKLVVRFTDHERVVRPRVER